MTKKTFIVTKNIKIDVLLSNLKKRYKLSTNEIIELFKEESKEIVIPVSIFSERLGMLEATSLYLKDELKLSFNEIANLVKRDYKTIWTSYNKAKQKLKNVR
jgi:predicted DNA-binding protein (UPF0251 family)